MIVPNKVTSLDDSVIGKICHLIVEDVEEIAVSELLDLRLKKFVDIGEFILALDVLYSLGRIELDVKRELVRYVD
ncbi:MULTISPECIES: ABC-three component system middle component 7 [Cycloclasticus]|uniref:Gas vesicle protein n=1 Tax=Cycloclasticus pugetii TaxID=34068 RepID=A0AB33Z285_9GAMM|nr:hypothetical protein CPC19_00315 [Cycloclasticus sp. PY97N]EPD13306.1 hypothetical protein L196_06675 [Cycloclasticus pugetii]